MNKTEILREEMAKIVSSFNAETEPCHVCYAIVDKQISLLESMGAYIPVEKELPECPVPLEDGLSPEIASFREYCIKLYCMAQLILLKAGWHYGERVKSDKEALK